MAISSNAPAIYFSGRQILAAVVTPLTIASGLFVRGSAYDLAASFAVDSVEIEGSVDDAEISSANALTRCYVSVKDDFTLTVTEITSTWGSASVLNSWVGTDYFLCELALSASLTAGSGAAPADGMVVQIPCKRRSIRAEYHEGKCTHTLTGVPCGLPMAWISAGQSLIY